MPKHWERSFRHLNINQQPAKDANVYVYNLEDQYNKNFNLSHGKLYNIYVIRNVYKHFASVIKRDEEKKKNEAKYFFLKYKEFYYYAKNAPKTTIIKYDKWFIDKKYRIEISKKLNLRFNDLGFKLPSASSS